LNQFRQYGDNTARSSYNQNPAIESLNGLKLKIPGLAKSLPQTYDTLGNPKENFQNGSNTFGNVFLNPSFVSKYAPSPEADKILNVYNKTGSTSQIPRVVKPEITTSDGKKFSLTPQEYSDYQRLVGEETKRGINGIDKNLSPQNQLKEMLSILNNADAVGKRIILERRGLGVDRKGNTLSIKK
jgi:hypothetical protein